MVTVLLCDLVGFTPLAEGRDPEDVRDIPAAYFGQMSQHIARYGGSSRNMRATPYWHCSALTSRTMTTLSGRYSAQSACRNL